jgi:tetratricopeptide (TPR) repeat protein
MDAVTYPQKAVQDILSESMVPVRIPFDNPLSQEYNITWIPALISLDWNGMEHYRTVGFMAPNELIPSLMLGCANVYGDLEHFDTAFAAINKILSDYPESDAAPKAIFMRGVYGYKCTHEPAALKKAYEQLEKHYPQNRWTKRAYPYRLL